MQWAIPEKIQTGERWVEDKEFPGGKERNSKGQLKKKWNFQGCSRKTHLKFPWVLVFLTLESWGVT